MSTKDGEQPNSDEQTESIRRAMHDFEAIRSKALQTLEDAKQAALKTEYAARLKAGQIIKVAEERAKAILLRAEEIAAERRGD